ncbi:MAG: hypothetical protein OHK0046_39070 [Anaerolineae bacterium]
MLRRIDRSKRLTKFIAQLSEVLARQRGLPVVIGIGLIILSTIVQSIDVYAESRFLELVGVLSHNLGVLIALIGLLLANPLGR